MRALVLVLALVAAPALAQQGLLYPGGVSGMNGVQAPAPVVLRAPLTTSGAPFECGANATSCPRFNGSAISDAPMTWTAQGTPVQVAANVSPFIPGTAGYGPPTDVNYYTGPGNGIDGWHPAGGLFRACIALKPNSIGAQTVPISTGNGAGGNVGFYTTQEPAGTMSLVIAAPGGGSVLTANTVVANGPNFFCFGRDSTNIYVKLNLGTTATTASSAWAAGANPTYLGRLWGATGYAFPGIIYSAVIEPIAWDETWAVDKQRRIAGMTGSFGEPVATVRATTEAFNVNSIEWAAPAGVAAFESLGLLAQRASTNSYLNSDAPATQTITYATGAEYAWLEGSGTIGLAVGTATATGLPCTASAASPCSFNVTVGGTVVLTKTGTVTYAQVDTGTSKTSKIHTTVAAVARFIDAHTVANPLTTGDSRWCVDATINPYAARAWTTSVNVAPWEIGTAGYGAANTALLYISATGLPTFEVYDAAAGQKKRVADGVINSSQHRIVVCDSDGVLSMQVDGVAQAAATTGAGTGLIGTMPATVRVGGGGMGNPLDGYVSSLNFARSSDPVVF